MRDSGRDPAFGSEVPLDAPAETGARIRIAVADDHKFVRDFVVGMLEKEPEFVVVGIAENGHEALEVVRNACPDIMVMDVGMPGMTGVEATKVVTVECPETRVLALSMYADPNYVAAMLDAGAKGYLLKDQAFDELPIAVRAVFGGHSFISPAVAVAANGRANEVVTIDLPATASGSSVISALSRLVEMRDPTAAAHQLRVAELSGAIARRLGMDQAAGNEIVSAALVHDVGRLAVPADILAKTGPLTAVERTLVQTHSAAGYHVIRSAKLEGPLADLVHQHHERIDGTGYPQKLVGAQMLPGAKILACADVVEAMCSHRPHRPALGIEAALEEVGSCGGFEPAVVDACIAVFSEEGFEFTDADAVAAKMLRNEDEDADTQGGTSSVPHRW